MIHRYLFSLALLGLSCSGLWAQDPMYSQFYASPLHLNPALTGLSAAPVFHLNYRNQWPGINNAYATYSASYSQYAPSLRSGFGTMVMADVAGAGIYNTTQVGLFYAYDIRFDDDFYIRIGMEGNFVNKRLNWSKLIFLDQLDPEFGAVGPGGQTPPSAEQIGYPSISYFDVGAGILVRQGMWYAGASFKHLNAPRQGFLNVNSMSNELPIRTSLHAGAEIPLQRYNKLKKPTLLSPNLLFAKQRQFHQLQVGAYLQHDVLLGGLAFRHSFGNGDATIFMAGLQFDMFKIAYSYDLTVSKLGVQSGGAHEISLVISLESTKKSTDYNDCLRIFR